MSNRETIRELRRRMAESLFGQEHVIDRLLIALLVNGHVLTEVAPGLPRAINELRKNLAAAFSRIQFTPDLWPSDVTGAEVNSEKDGQGESHVSLGPIFANLLLVDDINYAPVATQNVLLRAMEKRQVWVAGTLHRLPDLFFVQALENPFLQEENYPLTAAQRDRFLVKVVVDWPSEADLAKADRLICARQAETGMNEQPWLPPQAILDARAEVLQVVVSEALGKYIAALVVATWQAQTWGLNLGRWIQGGISSRGTQALARCARAHAWMDGRDHATPDDVRAVAQDCLRHRILLSDAARAEGVDADQVVTELVKIVEVRERLIG